MLERQVVDVDVSTWSLEMLVARCTILHTFKIKGQVRSQRAMDVALWLDIATPINAMGTMISLGVNEKGVIEYAELADVLKRITHLMKVGYFILQGSHVNLVILPRLVAFTSLHKGKLRERLGSGLYWLPGYHKLEELVDVEQETIEKGE